MTYIVLSGMLNLNSINQSFDAGMYYVVATEKCLGLSLFVDTHIVYITLWHLMMSESSCGIM